ncbi:MAG: hypothetical protein ACP5N3_02700 [Candidatus Nanoarchaeia archaeon]
MKLDKWLLALFVISVLFFAIPASVYAEGNESSGSGDDDEGDDSGDNSSSGSDDEPECSVDADCDADEFCDSNFECEDVEDENETEGISSSGSDDEPECSVDADCDADEFCDSNFECEDVEDENETEDNSSSGSDDDAECSVDADCGAGFYCDSNSECEDFEDENENESSDESEDELEVEDEDVSIIKGNHGAEVRLLQLQKSMVKQIKIGKLILNEIDNQNFSVDTTELESYVEDLADLNVEINEALEDETFNLTVEQFVAWRHEATKITFQFKAELYSVLTPEQLNIVKDAIKDKMNVKDDKELKVEEKFKLKVKEYNKEVALKMLEKFGGEDEELKERIEAGELDAAGLKVELREEYKNLGEARKNQLKIKIEEEKDNEFKNKLEIEAKVRGLNRSEVAKIASDDSLTWEEKQAKIKVLIEEQKALNQNISPENWKNNDDRPESKGPRR